eukprot:TRINITY_DN30245_c0_g1_i2.p1 TRINITY_DN30245_c0_g1~~TRINITY_DN30245_c0_g1_i2.p1  ORF type:complete len:198 (-),score=23.99 TRINITY_DN30245_c0_g1_i2:6-521(-)
MAPRLETPVVERKMVHVIRHGEAQHNVSRRCLFCRDTELTPRGRRQAKALYNVLANLVPKPQLVITSPILRALQTTKDSEFKGRVLVVPEARERVACRKHLCDLPTDPAGSPAAEFGSFDWSLAKGVVDSVGGIEEYHRQITEDDLQSKGRIHEGTRQEICWVCLASVELL